MTSSAAEGFRADVTVAARVSGDLHFAPDGSIEGALGPRRVHVPAVHPSAMSVTLRHESEALPPIP